MICNGPKRMGRGVWVDDGYIEAIGVAGSESLTLVVKGGNPGGHAGGVAIATGAA